MRSSAAKMHSRLTPLPCIVLWLGLTSLSANRRQQYWILAFFFLTICTVASVRADVNTDKAQSEKKAYTLVMSYLTAWQKGDYLTMYGLWDAKSRQMVTAE